MGDAASSDLTGRIPCAVGAAVCDHRGRFFEGFRTPQLQSRSGGLTNSSDFDIRVMSNARKPAPGTLEALATRWLASKQLARRSPASDAARRADWR